MHDNTFAPFPLCAQASKHERKRRGARETDSFAGASIRAFDVLKIRKGNILYFMLLIESLASKGSKNKRPKMYEQKERVKGAIYTITKIMTRVGASKEIPRNKAPQGNRGKGKSDSLQPRV